MIPECIAWPCVIVTIASVSWSGNARAEFVVAPNALANTEGPGQNFFPFFFGTTLSSQRYQQVYAAAQFSAVQGPQLITQIAFRPDAVNGQAFSYTLPNVQIDLSTTSKGPDGLSLTFADNVGPDDTVVHSGALALSSAFTGPTGGPKDFDIVIDLQTPFLYNPAAGNLLLDVRNFSGGGILVPVDAVVSTGDPVSNAFRNNDVNSPTAIGATTIGIVTRFTVTAVPEPASIVLLGFGVIGLLGARHAPSPRRQSAA